MKIDVEGDMEPAETFKGFKLPNDGKFSLPSIPIPLTKQEAMEWFSTRRQSIRPWSTFFSTSRFKYPKSAQRLSRRVVQNVDHFQSNYFFVFIGLFIYCLITSPLLLFAFAIVLGVCYGIFVKNTNRQVTLFGREVSLAQQYSLVGLCSMPLFYLVGAGGVMFWVLGASCFLIMAHAAFYDFEGLVQPSEETFELTMEEVV
ncbi:prenylated Rab acceptor protein 1 [Folsomia candida]|uniref:PRA1 family protein n=1 Tax=Folsomia candida TaxID=158441 RepID=A0A226D4N5_FOLCA|nr:prenylated Rab acceptor protein 1 [Folsomia candida]OXA40502.1 Prenylated Rab acceptor protein 1 [Folsomia candida]